MTVSALYEDQEDPRNESKKMTSIMSKSSVFER